jgi:membrane-associated phospholipid phosphatase
MRRRPSLAFLGALIGAGLLCLTWLAAFKFAPLERVDANVLSGFAGLHGAAIDTLALKIANVCDPKPFVILAALLVLGALLLRRGRVAAAVTGILLGANFTTQVLKSLLLQVHPVVIRVYGVPQVREASWPSGHATAAMSLALCAVLVARARWRPAVAATGAAFAVAVCFSFMILVWHYPSDVLGGFLVAATWTLMGVGVVWTADARWPRRAMRSAPARLTAREAFGPSAAALLAALAVGGLVALTRPHTVVAYARAHTAFVVGAAAIGVIGFALAVGLMLATTLRVPTTDSAPVPTAAPRRGSHRARG